MSEKEQNLYAQGRTVGHNHRAHWLRSGSSKRAPNDNEQTKNVTFAIGEDMLSSGGADIRFTIFSNRKSGSESGGTANNDEKELMNRARESKNYQGNEAIPTKREGEISRIRTLSSLKLSKTASQTERNLRRNTSNGDLILDQEYNNCFEVQTILNAQRRSAKFPQAMHYNEQQGSCQQKHVIGSKTNNSFSLSDAA